MPPPKRVAWIALWKGWLGSVSVGEEERVLTYCTREGPPTMSTTRSTPFPSVSLRASWPLDHNKNWFSHTLLGFRTPQHSDSPLWDLPIMNRTVRPQLPRHLQLLITTRRSNHLHPGSLGKQHRKTTHAARPLRQNRHTRLRPERPIEQRPVSRNARNEQRTRFLQGEVRRRAEEAGVVPD